MAYIVTPGDLNVGGIQERHAIEILSTSVDGLEYVLLPTTRFRRCGWSPQDHGVVQWPACAMLMKVDERRESTRTFVGHRFSTGMELSTILRRLFWDTGTLFEKLNR